MQWLLGKKTYIVAVLVALASLANNLGWISSAQYQMVMGIFGSLGLAALRSGVSDSKKETVQEIKQEVQVQGIQQGIKTRESTQEIKQEIANAPVVTLSPQGPQGGV